MPITVAAATDIGVRQSLESNRVPKWAVLAGHGSHHDAMCGCVALRTAAVPWLGDSYKTGLRIKNRCPAFFPSRPPASSIFFILFSYACCTSSTAPWSYTRRGSGPAFDHVQELVS